jgi:AsmA protein
MVPSATVISNPSPPPRKRLLRIAFIFAGLGIFLAIAAVSAPWAFSNAALRSEIAAQIRRLTGLSAISQGHAVFVVLPQPHISVDDVSFADQAGGLHIDARYLKGYVRLAPLLTGRIELVSVTLGQPNIDINLDARNFDAGPISFDSVIGRAAGAIPSTGDAASADAARLGIVNLVDGRARLKSAQLPSGLSIDAINMTLDWQKVGSAATVTGQANMGGETAEIAAWIASPAGLLRGQRSVLSLKVDAPSFSLAADGGFIAVPKWQFTGRLHTSAPSLRTLLEQAGYFAPLPGPFNGFDATCDANIEWANVVFSGLRLRFDGNDFEGALAFQARDKVPVISGTLATTQLSLRPLLSSLPAAAGRDGQWNREPFDLKAYGSADFDVRVSAAHLLFSHFEIEDAAFSLMRNSDRVEFTLAGARAYQGTAKGRVTLNLRDNGIAMQATAVVSGADLAALSFDAFGRPEFYGSLTGTVDLESTGSSLRDVMLNLGGMAHIDVAQGQVGGIDLDSALRRLDKSPLAILTGIRHGRTAFDHASFGLRFEKGVASIEEGKLENPALRLAFGGTVDFGERGLDLHAVATNRMEEAKSVKEAPDFRFDVGGSWDDLTFTPDVRSLIRRSGAAAPLFPQPPAGAPNHLGPGGEAAR